MGAELVEDEAVTLGPAHGCDVREVLRRAGSIDGPPTSIISTASSSVTPFFAATSFEGIEVDADEIERGDAVLGERGDVLVVVAAARGCRRGCGDAGLHAAAQHLGEVGERLDVLDRETEPFEVRRRAAARDELPAELVEAPREDVEPCLVVGRDQRAHSSPTTRGSRRCSISLMRACSVSAVSSPWTGRAPARGSGRCRRPRRRGARSRRTRRPRPRAAPRPRARRGTPAGAKGARSRPRPGSGRGTRRQEVHVAGEHDEVDAVAREASRPSRRRASRGRERRRARTTRSVSPASARSSAGCRVRLLATRRRAARVEEGLQVRALAADEDADHRARSFRSRARLQAARGRPRNSRSRG